MQSKHGQRFYNGRTGSQANFFSNDQVRNSFDKVITYDTSSLLDGLNNGKENHGRNSNRAHATIVPKLKRPVTS